MLSKPNAFGVLIMVFLCLLLVCFAASTIYADGAAGQWPISDPPPDNDGGSGEEGEGDGGDGIMALITIETLLQAIL